MKTFLTLLACFILFSPAEQSVADANGDRTALIGEWRVVDLVARGRHDSGVSFHGMRFRFDEEAMTTFSGNTTPAGLAKKRSITQKYTIDNSQNPKHLNLVFEGKEISRTMKAIYKVQDGKLYICMGGADRPTTFDTTGTKRGCYIAERVPKSETEPKQ